MDVDTDWIGGRRVFRHARTGEIPAQLRHSTYVIDSLQNISKAVYVPIRFRPFAMLS